MTAVDPPPRARIAEARRNRETLLAVAARAFATRSGRVPLESIAREAGVGIATLYRHFPTREALVSAVYQDQVERLGIAADALLADLPPHRALREWMDRFAEWAATKLGMIESVGAIVASGDLRYDEMRARLVAVVDRFLTAGRTAGDIRSDADPHDVAALLAAVLGADAPPAQRSRMLDIIADGLEAGPVLRR
ncbi:TetR/AcrR family transcriptional regulator [Leifsonia sp. C5G2]|uniref:TetR/AcrR family transcriptional regulator n=1 Tax=Leifsonia sp. C5G2 TaxID=2735269 RepID=UPI001585A6A4|nr:TetR/AcrR family transcriptional regulator [Leifsonia sp. C5G2]NUU07857.1 TetR/AcrR family transcriptional regulator [Leifsonia sp. C5G2]